MATHSPEPNGELRKQSKTQTILSIITGVASIVVLPLMGLVWNQTMELRVNSDAIKGTQAKIDQLQQALVTIHNQADENKGVISALRETMAADKAKRDAELTEQETQFASTENKLNSWMAEQHRMNAIMWGQHKVLGDYPSGPFFFSNISQHNR